MGKLLFLISFISIFTCSLQAQEEKAVAQPSDSLAIDLGDEGIVVNDSIVKRKVKINPLAPSRAAFYSAVFPGMGQIYNKRYWKVPIVYAALGAGIYFYDFNNGFYQRFRTAFKRRQAGFIDDEFYDRDNNNPEGAPPDFDLDVLENQQERYQRDRDLALVVTIVLYALNIVDANVDAHLKQFNVDDDLSFEMQPYLEMNPINNIPNYGMSMVVRF